MVKTLVLVRHGSPEPASASGSDFDRQLTASGARALRSAYPRTFALLGDDVDARVWSSPALRALQTADVVADALDASGIEPHECLYAQNVPAFLDELSSCEAETLVVVGHAPFMDQVAARLDQRVPVFDKGAAAAFDLRWGAGSDASGPEGRLCWFVAGPRNLGWEELAFVEDVLGSAASEVCAQAEAFLATPEDAQVLLRFRVSLRRVRSLLQFVSPWQAKKQNRPAVRSLKELQEASSRLRALDILTRTVSDLVEGGELAENSLLPMACARERSLECESLLTLMRKHSSAKALRKLAAELSHVRWKGRVAKEGLTSARLGAHFDEELAEVDDSLFGLDLRDGNAVFEARRDAKELHYVAERLGGLLGPERAQMSASLDEVQVELGQLSDARRNQRLAQDCAKSPRFRGVRADLGVVARDQAEVVSAITQGMELMESAERAGAADAAAEPVAAAEPAPEAAPEPPVAEAGGPAQGQAE